MPNKTKLEMIILAAIDLIAERGFHDAPTTLIAKRAGVSTGALFHYFKNKDELIKEIFSYTNKKFYGAVLKGYSPEKSIQDRFFHLCTAMLRYFIKHPALFHYADQFFISPFGSEIRFRMMQSELDVNDPFLALLIEGIARKEIVDLPIPVHNALTFNSLVGLARSHFDGCKLDDKLINRAVESCWNAIKLHD